MTATVVLAHPYENSFNHALFHRTVDTLAAAGARTFAHDLYRERFDPVLTRDELGKKPTKDKKVRRYTDELMASDALIFVHPNWWGQPPALLKGYLDRVFRPPHAYEEATGKLGGKRGLVFTTSATDEERERDYFGDPLEALWTRCVFGFCGMTDTRRVNFAFVGDVSLEQRVSWLEEAAAAVRTLVESEPRS
jgi:putative NADPH-quinone reductase